MGNLINTSSVGRANDINNNAQEIAKNSVVGKRGSEHVKVYNRPGPIANSAAKVMETLAEEITQMRSMFTKLDDRKLSKGEAEIDRLLKQIKKIKEVEKISRLEDFKKSFANSKQISKENILQKAEHFSKDVFHQFVAIAETAEEFKAFGKDVTEFYAALDKLYADHNQQIQASLNITEQAKELSDDKSFSNVTDLRKDYTDNIIDHTTLKKTYSHLADKYSVKDLSVAIEIHLKLLATDLNSLKASSSKTKLNLIISDLSQLKVIANCYDNCKALTKRFTRTYNVEAFKTEQILEKMVTFIEKKWVTENDFANFIEDLNIKQLDQQIFIITQLQEMIREIPEAGFDGGLEEKKIFLSSAQSSLDNMIFKEENPEQENEIKDEDKDFGILGEAILDDFNFIKKK